MHTKGSFDTITDVLKVQQRFQFSNILNIETNIEYYLDFIDDWSVLSSNDQVIKQLFWSHLFMIHLEAWLVCTANEYDIFNKKRIYFNVPLPRSFI